MHSQECDRAFLARFPHLVRKNTEISLATSEKGNPKNGIFRKKSLDIAESPDMVNLPSHNLHYAIATSPHCLQSQ